MISPNHPEFGAPPAQPELCRGSVHLWRAELEASDGDDVTALEALLSPEEQRRARCRRLERERRRFIRAHGYLRIILGRYLQQEPAEVELVLGEYGKPRLAREGLDCQFNLSHSGGLMLLAVTQSREIGVDLEEVRDGLPFEAIAWEQFTGGEAEKIQTAQGEEQKELFFRSWTVAEARLKALGTGFAGPSRVVRPDRWAVRSLSPAPGYAAAVAMEGEEFDLRCFAWPV